MKTFFFTIITASVITIYSSSTSKSDYVAKISVFIPELTSEYIGNISLYHIDCYRLDTSFDFLNIGGEEYLNPIDGITLIEWPERINDLWSDDWIYIYFKRIEEDANTRIIKIKGKLD